MLAPAVVPACSEEKLPMLPVGSPAVPLIPVGVGGNGGTQGGTIGTLPGDPLLEADVPISNSVNRVFDGPVYVR